jgi:lipid-binding SYLF domain-containing protein
MKSAKTVIYSVILLFASANVCADEYSDTVKMFKSIERVNPFFSRSYGYAVFPSIGKGGFVLGAAFGRGRVYVNDRVTGLVKMSQVTVGAQLGGQTYSQIIFFEDDRAYKDFTIGEFEFGAHANAIAVTSSAQAQAGTTGSSAGTNEAFSKTGYYKGMIVFTKGNAGLMFEASIGGQKYKFTPLEKTGR